MCGQQNTFQWNPITAMGKKHKCLNQRPTPKIESDPGRSGTGKIHPGGKTPPGVRIQLRMKDLEIRIIGGSVDQRVQRSGGKDSPQVNKWHLQCQFPSRFRTSDGRGRPSHIVARAFPSALWLESDRLSGRSKQFLSESFPRMFYTIDPQPSEGYT